MCVLEYHGEKHKPDVEMEGYQGNTETIEMNGEQQISNEPIKQVVYVPESHGNPTGIQAMVQQRSQINSNVLNDKPSDNAAPPAYTQN